MSDYPLTHLQRRLLEPRDAKLRHCWWCGEWCWDKDDCTVCAAPATKAQLLHEGRTA